MPIERVRNYLSSSVKTPYFLAIGDGEYKGVKEKLTDLGLGIIRVSDYCRKNDRQPDIDGLLEYLKTADVKPKGKKMVVIGLGEYLALRGNSAASSVLSQLKEMNLGTVKAVLLLRGITGLVKELHTDPRFDGRRYSILDKTGCEVSITIAAAGIGLPAMPGLKALLTRLENGECGNQT